MFGEILSKYRVDFYTIRVLFSDRQHVADAVSPSSKGNEAVIIQNGSVKYREWKEFIQTAFLPLKGIRKFHLFISHALLFAVLTQTAKKCQW